MAFQVFVTEVANNDLAEIIAYISADNPDAAKKFGAALLHRLRLLPKFPLLGRIVPERGDPDIRELIHKSYRIIYRVRDEKQLVQVLRFWHGARGAPEIPATIE